MGMHAGMEAEDVFSLEPSLLCLVSKISPETPVQIPILSPSTNACLHATKQNACKRVCKKQKRRMHGYAYKTNVQMQGCKRVRVKKKRGMKESPSGQAACPSSCMQRCLFAAHTTPLLLLPCCLPNRVCYASCLPFMLHATSCLPNVCPFLSFG